MTPHGAEPLIKLRQQGKRPAGPVWVNIDAPPVDWWKWQELQAYPTLTVRTTYPIDRLDLRCLIGLSVVLHFPDWNNRVSRLLDRINEIAGEVAVLSPSFGEDCGFWLIPSLGQFPISEYPISQRRIV